MKRLILIFFLAASALFGADMKFEEMLAAARSGDDMARVAVAYSYFLGEYRDGTKIEKNLAVAYAWASLANYQGNEEARKLVEGIIPKLDDRKKADDLAGEYFKRYGAKKGSAKNPK